MSNISSVFLSAIKLLAGDPKTKIPKYIVLAGIAGVASQWWQPYLHLLLELVLGIKIEVLSKSDNKAYVGGWILIIIGLASYLYVTQKLANLKTDTSPLAEIREFLVNDLHTSWGTFSDQLQITDHVRSNQKKLSPEVQKRSFHAYMTHISAVEMKRRIYMNDLDKLRLMKHRLTDEIVIKSITGYFLKGISICNDSMNEEQDRQESVDSIRASYDDLIKLLSERLRST